MLIPRCWFDLWCIFLFLGGGGWAPFCISSKPECHIISISWVCCDTSSPICDRTLPRRRLSPCTSLLIILFDARICSNWINPVSRCSIHLTPLSFFALRLRAPNYQICWRLHQTHWESRVHYGSRRLVRKGYSPLFSETPVHKVTWQWLMFYATPWRRGEFGGHGEGTQWQKMWCEIIPDMFGNSCCLMTPAGEAVRERGVGAVDGWYRTPSIRCVTHAFMYPPTGRSFKPPHVHHTGSVLLVQAARKRETGRNVLFLLS